MSKILIVAGLEDKCAATSRGLQLAELMDLQVEVVAFAYANLKRLKLDKGGIADVKQRLLNQRRQAVDAQLERLVGPEHRAKVASSGPKMFILGLLSELRGTTLP